MRTTLSISIAFVALAVAGCSSSERDEATGKGSIRALNAAVNSPEIAFLLEERPLNSVQFKQGTAPTEFDDLAYIANFEYRIIGADSPTRLASVPFEIEVDNDYLFVFTGSISSPNAFVWDRPQRDFDPAETVFEIEFGHLSQLGEFDLYFAVSGTPPAAGQAIATLTNGNRSSMFEFESGNYVLTLTEPGMPATVIFESSPFNYLPRVSHLAASFDADASSTSPVSMGIITATGQSVELVNSATMPTLRTFHAAFGTGNVDLFRDNDFSAPVIPDTAFGEVSQPVSVSSANANHSFTEAANVGNILLEEEFSVPTQLRVTNFLLDQPSALQALRVIDDFRAIDVFAKFRIIQSSINQAGVDIYLVEQGVDIANENPLFSNLPSVANSNYLSARADVYEMYLTTPATKDILAGPQVVQLANGDVVHFAILDTVDPNVLSIVEYDHTSLP